MECLSRISALFLSIPQKLENVPLKNSSMLLLRSQFSKYLSGKARQVVNASTTRKKNKWLRFGFCFISMHNLLETCGDAEGNDA